jgi:hypothetical protein
MTELFEIPILEYLPQFWRLFIVFTLSILVLILIYNLIKNTIGKIVNINLSRPINNIIETFEKWYENLRNWKRLVFNSLILGAIASLIAVYFDRLILAFYSNDFIAPILLAIAAVYLGRAFYKYVVSSLIPSWALSRHRTVVAKLLIHKYYLRDYSLLNFITRNWSLDHITDITNSQIEEKNLDTSQFVPIKCYMYIIHKSVIYFSWGLAFVAAAVFFLVLSHTTFYYLVLTLAYLAIQFFLQGITWLRPMFLRFRSLDSGDKEMVEYVNYLLFRNKLDLNVDHIIEETSSFKGFRSEFEKYKESL